MYKGSERNISNKAYAVVKKHRKGKFNRTAYRQEMKKKFKIKSRDADRLRIDYGQSKLTAMFKQHWTMTIDLKFCCCRGGNIDESYKPDYKGFVINSGGDESMTKIEFRDYMLDVQIYHMRDYYGENKCKDMSVSQLEVCEKVGKKNMKISGKKVPLKKR